MSALTTVAPQWIRSALQHKDGRDPLGFQTTTQDRLMPALLPDVNELTRRARYLSFYAFLLHRYQAEKRPLNRQALSRFIKAREWDLGLAVQRCPNGCGSSPVGAMRLRGAVEDDGHLPRGESVESANGGYGLYYRSSMLAFDLAVPSGTTLGDGVTPIDVISPREHAQELARAFESAVADTAYLERYWTTTDPIPVEVIEELAEVACLCRLERFTEERDLVHSAMFTSPHPEVALAVEQRRRSFAHYLTLLDTDPDIRSENATFRKLLWETPQIRSDTHREVADQWAGLVIKDLFQDAACSLWTHLLRTAYAAGGLDGLDRAGFEGVLDRLCDLAPQLDGSAPTLEQVHALGWPMEHAEALRRVVADADSATAAVVGLVALPGMVAARDTVGWRHAIDVASQWQPSVRQIAQEVSDHLEQQPTVRDTIGWAVRRLIVTPHERIAYSKLPEFTFRFRSGPKGLRFFDLYADRFILAGIRHDTLATLTHDLGLRADGDPPVVTSRGQGFVSEVLG